MNREKREMQKETMSPEQILNMSCSQLNSISSFAEFNTTHPVPVQVKVEPSCKGTEKKEKIMQLTDAQYKMNNRVEGVVGDARSLLKTKHHIYPDKSPTTVQGVLDAISSGHFRPMENVKPETKIPGYASLENFFEFRSHDPDRKGYDEQVAVLDHDDRHVRDSIDANPDPLRAYADFQAFLKKWEPKPGELSN